MRDRLDGIGILSEDMYLIALILKFWRYVKCGYKIVGFMRVRGWNY